MRNKKILIIDDEKIYRDLIKTLLHEYDPKMRVDTAKGLVTRDIKDFESFSAPDLILLDWMLGDIGMTGLQILQQIKKNPLTRKIPVVMITGMSDPSEVQKALKYKVDGYMVKPLNKEKLFTVLDKHLKEN